MRKSLNNTKDTTNTYSVCFKIMTGKIHKKKLFEIPSVCTVSKKMAMCVHRKMHRNVCLFHILHYRNCVFRKKPTPIENKIHQHQRIHPNVHTQIHTNKVIHHAHTDALSPVI